MSQHHKAGLLRRTPTQQYNEQRRARRLPTRLRVDYCPLVDRSSGHLAIGGLTRGIAGNLSASGLFLGETGYLKVGALLHLFLRLPDLPGNPVVCYARVVRRQGGSRPGYGLRFLRLPSGDNDRLQRFVDIQRARARLSLSA